ncbi:Phospholipase/carboxylesterase [Meredithblackwellia eburnea MCA 4105]
MASQAVVEAIGKHTATVIFSHGLGDTAAGWKPVAQALNRRFPQIRWILPTAPIQPVTLNGGYKMTSWFDIKTLEPPTAGLPSDEDEAGMLQSVKRISDIVAAEVDAGIPAERIVVGGFSQGAVVALLTGLTLERKIAGVISFSGWLALSQKAHAMQTDNARKLPILWGHGTSDQIVKFKWGELSVEKLRSLGFKNIEFNSYPGMQHSFCEEEQEHLEAWLKKTLPDVVEGTGAKVEGKI